MEATDPPLALSHRPRAPAPSRDAFYAVSFAGPAPAQFAGQPPAEAAPVVKKKRGRPRKYGPPSPRLPAAHPLPAPKSPAGSIASSPEAAALKRKAASAGIPGFGFTPHVLFVETGEDVYEKVTSFMQTIHPFKSCILSASGTVRDVILKLPTGVCTLHKGSFVIVSLSGMNADLEAERSENIKIAICVNPERTEKDIGGEVKGPLIAESIVQVIIGSFSTNKRQDKLTSPKEEESHNNQLQPSAPDQGRHPIGQFGTFRSMDSTIRETDRDQVQAISVHQTQILQPRSGPLAHSWAAHSSSSSLSVPTMEGVNPPIQARNAAPDVAQPRQSNPWWMDITKFGGSYYRSGYNDDDML